MVPKLDRGFYRLTSEQRQLYLTGMPRELCCEKDRAPQFANVRLPTKVLSSLEQATKFGELLQEFPGDSLIVISSNQTDRDALIAVSHMVRHYIKLATREIEFVHPTEPFAWNAERLRDLYVLTGIHERDLDILHHVRRWVRSSLGVPRVLVVTTSDPYKWCSEQLGCLPQFLFHVKLPARSLG